MTLGERIRYQREQMKMSRDDVARLTGISLAQVSRYENDESQPTASALIALARTLSASIDWLVGIEEAIGDEGLNAQEIEILRLFREKSPERRLAALEIMKWA